MKLTKEQFIEALRKLPQEKPPFSLVASIMNRINEPENYPKRTKKEISEEITIGA
jgi:hypothetical protein